MTIYCIFDCCHSASSEQPVITELARKGEGEHAAQVILYNCAVLPRSDKPLDHKRSFRNTIIVAVAAAASISASFAGYFAAEAQKNFALSNAAVTKAVKYEHQADLQASHDEELLIQATIEYHRNETRIGDFLVNQVSDLAKQDMSVDLTNLSYSLPQKYYDDTYSDYEIATAEEHDYLTNAELSDAYTKISIIATSLLTAGIVIFSEFTRKQES